MMTLETVRSSAIIPAQNNDGMPHAHGGSDLSGYAAKVDALERRIEEKRIEAVESAMQIESLIELLDDPLEQAVIRLRYISCQMWDAIPILIRVADSDDDIGRTLSERTIFAVHGSALKNLAEKMQ